MLLLILSNRHAESAIAGSQAIFNSPISVRHIIWKENVPGNNGYFHNQKGLMGNLEFLGYLYYEVSKTVYVNCQILRL